MKIPKTKNWTLPQLLNWTLPQLLNWTLPQLLDTYIVCFLTNSLVLSIAWSAKYSMNRTLSKLLTSITGMSV